MPAKIARKGGKYEVKTKKGTTSNGSRKEAQAAKKKSYKK